MRIVVSLLCLVVLFGCSKPESTTQAADTTAVAPRPDPGITLTDKEYERVNWELFLAIHKEFAERPNSVVYKEDFSANRDQVNYTLSLFYLDGLLESPGKGVDTIVLEQPAYYNVSLVEGTPESNLKTVAVFLKDVFYYESYIETAYGGGFEKMGDAVGIDTVIVNLSTPLNLTKDQLYLRARVSNLTDNLLSKLTKDELGFLRNEIFARHGHTFKTQKMIDHFSNMDWYHATVADASVYLNEFEKRNVDLIKSKEI